MKADDVARSLIKRLNVRTHLIVPRVSWGLVNWGECDVLAMTGAGYLTEYEIKISASDVRREWKKKRWTSPRYRQSFDALIKEYYMVVPEKLLDVVLETMPEDIGGGVIVADRMQERQRWWPEDKEPEPYAACVQNAVSNRRARALTDREKYQLARLGTMRYWSLLAKSGS